jgi:hypothetical protein
LLPSSPIFLPSSPISAVAQAIKGLTTAGTTLRLLQEGPPYIEAPSARTRPYVAEIESRYTMRRQLIPFDLDGRRLDVFLRGQGR